MVTGWAWIQLLSPSDDWGLWGCWKAWRSLREKYSFSMPISQRGKPRPRGGTRQPRATWRFSTEYLKVLFPDHQQKSLLQRLLKMEVLRLQPRTHWIKISMDEAWESVVLARTSRWFSWTESQNELAKADSVPQMCFVCWHYVDSHILYTLISFLNCSRQDGWVQIAWLTVCRNRASLTVL